MPTVFSASSGSHWAATQVPDIDPGQFSAWFVDADGATGHGDIALQKAKVRCVRHEMAASQSNPRPSSYGRYLANEAAKTVLDKLTGRTWQRNPPLVGGDGSGRFTWAAAKTYCTDLVLGGFGDWRLPSVVELRAIVGHASGWEIAIDSVAFPDTPIQGTGYYWSSTAYMAGTTAAWMVAVSGSLQDFTISMQGRVRCVR
jgi:hypothetical protein